MREKVVRHQDKSEVIYSDKDWSVLRGMRQEAINIMKILQQSEIPSTVHGSVARGDVSPRSDIDIFIPMQVSSFKVEMSLRGAGLEYLSRRIELATPQHAIKAHIDFNVNRTITFPLVNPKRREWEFYRFGGVLDFIELMNDKRVVGVDKRLLLIEPTARGHFESSIVGRERSVAKLLGVSLDLVEERVRVLSRRDAIGRTGVYLKHDLSPDENFEEVLKKISERDPIIRRRLMSAGR